VRLRALMGEWEDGSVLFLGAVEYDQYEALLEGDDDWADQREHWVNRGPAGIGETREVDVTLDVPYGLFEAPILRAEVPAEKGQD